MPIAVRFRRLVFAQVLLGIVAFCIAEQNPAMLLAVGALGALAWYVTEGPNARTLPRWAVNVGVLTAAAWVPVSVLIYQANLVLAMGHFVIWLQILLLYTSKTNREYGPLMVLSVLAMVGASVLSVSMLYAALLAAYCILALVTTVLFQFKIVSDHVYHANRAAAPPGAAVGMPRPLRGGGYRWHLRLAVTTVGAICAAVAVLVFLLAPRQDPMVSNLFNPERSAPQIGFTDEVHLGGGGPKPRSREPVLNLQMTRYGESLGSDVAMWHLRGVALDRYDPYTHTWTRGARADVSDRVVAFEDGKADFVAIPHAQHTIRAQITLRQRGDRTLFAPYPVVAIQSRNISKVHFSPLDQVLSCDPTARAVIYSVSWPVRIPGDLQQRYEAASKQWDFEENVGWRRLMGRHAEKQESRKGGKTGKQESRKAGKSHAGSKKRHRKGATGGLPASADHARALALADSGQGVAPPPREDSGHHRRRRHRAGYARQWTLERARIAKLDQSILRKQHLRRDPKQPHAKDDLEIAHALADYLKSNYQYTLDNPALPPDQDPVLTFLFRRQRGHCELFAAGLVAMLRSINIPARMVVGYLATDYNPLGGYYVVRDSDAHAWVEVDAGPGRGWRTVDPTPASAVLAEHADHGWLAPLRHLYDEIDFIWTRSIVAYDAQSRTAVLGQMRAAIHRTLGVGTDTLWRVVAWLRQLPQTLRMDRFSYTLIICCIAAIAVAVGYLIWLLVIRRQRLAALQLDLLPRGRRRGMTRRLRFYLTMLDLLERHSFVRPAWQSPFSFAQELAEAYPLRFDPVVALTELFYEIRFGHRQLTPDRRQRIRVHMRQLEHNLAEK